MPNMTISVPMDLFNVLEAERQAAGERGYSGVVARRLRSAPEAPAPKIDHELKEAIKVYATHRFDMDRGVPVPRHINFDYVVKLLTKAGRLSKIDGKPIGFRLKPFVPALDAEPDIKDYPNKQDYKGALAAWQAQKKRHDAAEEDLLSWEAEMKAL